MNGTVFEANLHQIARFLHAEIDNLIDLCVIEHNENEADFKYLNGKFEQAISERTDSDRRMIKAEMSRDHWHKLAMKTTWIPADHIPPVFFEGRHPINAMGTEKYSPIYVITTASGIVRTKYWEMNGYGIPEGSIALGWHADTEEFERISEEAKHEA